MNTGISLVGRALTHEGQPIAGATATAAGRSVTTDDDGWFRFDDLCRHNQLVEIEAPGKRSHQLPAWLLRPLDILTVTLDAVALEPDDESSVRFLFTGDLAFGRRYLDPDEKASPTALPPSNPAALIDTADPLPGTRNVLSAVAPYFADVDFPVINLESAVTDRPYSPHPTKDFTFFTLPGSLPALTELGVKYVSLGNNHTYDYLEEGLADTLDHVDAAGLFRSGLGYTPEDAWKPYRTTLAGSPYSLISACSVNGYQHKIKYVATDTQGGAADLRDNDMMRAVFNTEVNAGQIPIALLHTGEEYTFSPGEDARLRMEKVAQLGAGLVVGNHPHVAQGFAKYGTSWVAHSLGNFTFDEERLDATTGLLLQADMAGAQVRDLEAIPIQIEHYWSRPVTGELANLTLRRVAEFSEVPVFPWADRVEITASGIPSERTITVKIEVDASGVAILDTRPLAEPGESLAHALGPVTVRPGRDLMLHGTMEDLDIDDDAFELASWDLSPTSVYTCVSGAKRGALGLCSSRSSSNSDPSIAQFRERIRVWGDATDTPNKDLTLYGWVAGENAGHVEVVVEYTASYGDRKFGKDVAWSHPGGDYAWTTFAFDLKLPADTPGGNAMTNPRAIQFDLRHTPPKAGRARVTWDDFALISWEETLELAAGVELTTPHARDFLRVQAAPGTYDLQLTFRKYKRF